MRDPFHRCLGQVVGDGVDEHAEREFSLELVRAPPQHRDARPPRRSGELLQQPGLPDPRLADHLDEPRDLLSFRPLQQPP
ncbi:hypothetical protein BJ998_007393 [Kutzneria kofuensis]|uniref:Uncharacterized protein n=1 Tax=Kutzneria kofuensis TaxID=103725 RepID=A0A7W9NK07_9PSEU|nr:hypothetical protein [Kutzneria kofuensis]